MDVERLRLLPLFGELDHHDLSQLLRWVREVEFADGDLLFEQGSMPHELFVIEDGSVEVSRDGRSVATLGPGEVVGEMALLKLERRWASVSRSARSARWPSAPMTWPPCRSRCRSSPIGCARACSAAITRTRSSAGPMMNVRERRAPDMRTLIQGGTVVTATETTEADVVIEDEKVAAIGRGMAVEADRTIDATGRYVMPGGVDVHTHMELPFGGSFCSDDFETGTRAAAFGGTTTIVDFALQDYGEGLRQGLDRWFAKAQNATTDYGFHVIIREVNDQVLKEMDELVGEGVTSFKLFMAYPGVFMLDDASIFRAMRQAGQSGALIMMHAENGGPIDVLVRQFLDEGKTAPVNHGLTRPPSMEGEAVHRVFRLAELADTPAYIVHLSSRDALNVAARGARSRPGRRSRRPARSTST